MKQKQRKGNRIAHPRGTEPRVNPLTKRSAPQIINPWLATDVDERMKEFRKESQPPDPFRERPSVHLVLANLFR